MHFTFRRKRLKENRIYLDYASATPVDEDVYKAMVPYFSSVYGNPGAIHTEGALAKKAITDAREGIARTLRIRQQQVTFTSGGTESNNLMILGLYEALENAHVSTDDIEIITTATEHPSVLETVQYLKRKGVRVTYVPIDTEGRVIIEDFENALSPRTRLVTIAYANSETGVVQDLKRLSRAVRAYEKRNSMDIVLHTDASQVPLWRSCALDALGVDALTLDAGKFCGPKGVGVLAYRGTAELCPHNLGGGQESGLRSGTENVPLIVGCCKAFTKAQEACVARHEAVMLCRDAFLAKLTEAIPSLVVNGSMEYRLPNNINISLPGIDTEYAVVSLDAQGVAASTKSACGSMKGGGSHVIWAMTEDDRRSQSTLRFTLGGKLSEKKMNYVVEVLKVHVEKMSQFTEELTE